MIYISSKSLILIYTKFFYFIIRIINYIENIFFSMMGLFCVLNYYNNFIIALYYLIFDERDKNRRKKMKIYFFSFFIL